MLFFFICLILFFLPFYLIRFKIFWVPFNLLEIFIYLAFLIWVLKKKKNSLKVFKEHKEIFYPVFLIFIGATVSTLFSQNLFVSAGIWKSWILAPILFFIVSLSEVKTIGQIKKIILSLSFSGFTVSVISLFYWLKNDLTYDDRLRAFYLSPNFLAMYLSPILALSLILFFLIKKNLLKFLILFNCILLCFVIYLTKSHGAWLGLAVAALFLILRWNRA